MPFRPARIYRRLPPVMRQKIASFTTHLAFAGGGALVLMACLIQADVLMRWLFNAPIIGVDDLSGVIAAVVVASFFPAGIAHGQLLTIRFLGQALGIRASSWLDLLGAIAALLVFGLLTWQLSSYALNSLRTREATLVAEFPVGPWWLVVAILFCICTLVQAYLVGLAAVAAVRGRPDTQLAHDDTHAV